MALSKNSPFTPAQVRAQHIMARAAYSAEKMAGKTSGQGYDDWRRAILFSMTGSESFKTCRQSDYAALAGHWKHLAGDDAGAYKSLVKSGRENEVDAAQTIWHLNQEIRAIGAILADSQPEGNHDSLALGRTYCLAIAAAQFRRPGLTWERLLMHTPKEHQNLVFTLRARRRVLALKTPLPESELDPF